MTKKNIVFNVQLMDKLHHQLKAIVLILALIAT
jgi:hypothetical protein